MSLPGPLSSTGAAALEGDALADLLGQDRQIGTAPASIRDLIPEYRFGRRPRRAPASLAGQPSLTELEWQDRKR